MSGTGIERPTGVTILVILVFIVGLFGALLGFLLLIASGIATDYGYGFIEAFLEIFGAILLLLGLVSFVDGWGLWNLKKWGFQLAMILSVIGIIWGIISLPIGIILIIIYGIIVYYLTRPEIKDVFGITGFLS